MPPDSKLGGALPGGALTWAPCKDGWVSPEVSARSVGN